MSARIAILISLTMLLTLAAPAVGQQTPGELLQSALYKQQVEGDLQGAVTILEGLIEDFGQNREIAARALVQLGRAHETLGSTEAQRAYQRIVSDYPDQQEQVAVARSRLAALTQPATVVAASGVVVRQVWTSPASAVSPDGRYVVFKDKGDLAVRDLRTGENRRLAGATGRISDFPAMSPDGQQVAYLSWDRDDSELHLRDLDGSRPRVLVSNPEVSWLEPSAWSPDGKQILTVFERRDGTAQIVLVSAADGSVRVLKSLEWRWPLQMRFSPDGRYIAYDAPRRRDSPEREILVLATDGSREGLLVARPADYSFPLWTPDGNAILFLSRRSGNWDQWLVPVAQGRAQGSPTLIKENVGPIEPLRFTTDGSYYYNLRTGSSLDVYIAALDPATGRPLGAPALVSDRLRGGNTLPEWSPDGQHLAYLSRRGGPDSRSVPYDMITIRSLETGEERELTPQLSFLEDTRLRWSPDGGSFLVSGEENDGHRGLYQIDAQTGDVTPIVVTSREHPPESRRNRWHAEWSLDGKAIFYVYDEDGNSCEIRIRDMETGEERLLYRAVWPDNMAGPGVPVHLSNLALSPDGRRLAFGVGGNHFAARVVLAMPTSGGEPHELWRFEQGTESWATYSIAWTRDGSHLLFSKRIGEPRTPSELWRVSAAGGEPQKLGLAMWGRGGVRAHPDGRRITFTYQTDRNNQLWMMENFLPEPSGAR